MKQIIISFSVIVLFSQYGCEEVIGDSSLPYEEKLVIRGIVTGGDIIDSLYIGRTLPYEEFQNGYWNPKDTSFVENDHDSYVKDAIVTITVDGKTYPMFYFKSGYYKNDSLTGSTGKTYRLHVEWKGKTADAVTTIPEAPILDSVSVAFKTTRTDDYGSGLEYSCSAYARTKTGNILYLDVGYRYTEKYVFDTTKHFTYTSYEGKTVQKRVQTDNSISDILIQKISLYNSLYYKPIDPQLVFILRSYDEPFYKYYLTSGGDIATSSFSIEPRPIAWNVEGDAIGMFIGASQSVTKIYKLK